MIYMTGLTEKVFDHWYEVVQCVDCGLLFEVRMSSSGASCSHGSTVKPPLHFAATLLPLPLLAVYSVDMRQPLVDCVEPIVACDESL